MFYFSKILNSNFDNPPLLEMEKNHPLAVDELILRIFSFLGSQDLEACSRVSQLWRILAYDESLVSYFRPRKAIGAAEWGILGDVGIEPPISYEMINYLKRECPVYYNAKDVSLLHRVQHMINKMPCDRPFWPDNLPKELLEGHLASKKRYRNLCPESEGRVLYNGSCSYWPSQKVKDTHTLALIPCKIDGKSLDFKEFIARIRSKLSNLSPVIESIFLFGDDSSFGKEKIIEVSNLAKPCKRSYWIIITNDIIPGSKLLNYEEQEVLVGDLSTRVKVRYEIPKVLEAFFSIAMENIVRNDFIFNYHLQVKTRCKEKINEGSKSHPERKSRIVVGKTENKIPKILLPDCDFQSLIYAALMPGVAVVCKF